MSCLHLHFAPAYTPWLDQVVRWFAPVTERAIRRYSLTSVRELKQQIERGCERVSQVTL